MATNIHDELAAIREEHRVQDTSNAALATKIDALQGTVTKIGVDLAEILAFVRSQPTPAGRWRTMVVTYFRRQEFWDATLAVKPPFTIINPGNGDALTADSLYVAQVPKNAAAGVPTFIYTHTKYGARPEAEVIAAVKRQLGFYPQLEGVFVDTVGNGHGTLGVTLPYYESLGPKLRALKPGLKLCFNTGNVGDKTPERLAQLCDYMMSREASVTTYKGFVMMPWELKPEYAGKFWHVAHGCSLAEMPAVVALMKKNGAGLLTVTDDAMAADGNPYDMLPTYLTALVAAVRTVG